MTEEKNPPAETPGGTEFYSLNIVKHLGTPVRANFLGQTVTRQETIYIEDWDQAVPCAPYDNHFVFELPKAIKPYLIGMSDLMCTCGAVAIVPNPQDAAGRMVCCYFHATYGYHQTKIINKDDFQQYQGQLLDPTRGRKTLI